MLKRFNLVQTSEEALLILYRKSPTAEMNMAVSTMQTGLETAESSTCDLSFCNQTQSGAVHRFGNICTLTVDIGGSTFSDATGADVIGELSSDLRPSRTYYCAAVARDASSWASSNYTECLLMVATNGKISVRGTASTLKTMKYITGTIIWCI